MAPHREISVLGPVTLLLDGVSVPIRGLLSPTLLAILAFEPGPQHRRTMVEMLWGEAVLDGGAQERSAYNRLYTATNVLRGSLQDDRKEVIATDRGRSTIELVRGADLYVDVDRLRREAKIGSTAPPWWDVAAPPCQGLEHPALLRYRDDVQRLVKDRQRATSIARRTPLRIADSALIVIRSILASWGLDDIVIPHGYTARYIHVPWGSEILSALESSRIDLAIYNRMEATAYTAGNPGTSIRVLGSFGHSMGGRNFSILAHRNGPWADASPHEFLSDPSGARFVVPAMSDMYSNLLAVLNMRPDDLARHEISVMHSDDAAVQFAENDSGLLLVGGQNIRFQALASGAYAELVTCDHLDGSLQSRLHEYSENVLLARSPIIDDLDEVGLTSIYRRLHAGFVSAWQDPERYPELIDELSLHAGIPTNVALVRHIVYECYRFGSPEQWRSS